MKKIIEISDLKKSFGRGTKEVKAVQGINLEIYEKEIFSILGPNGAGKTTTIRMIVGLLQPDGGQVRIFGQDPQKNGKDLKR